MTCDVKVLPNNKSFDGPQFQGLQGVVDTKAVPAGVLADFVKVPLNEFFLLNKLDVGKRFSSEFDGLLNEGVSVYVIFMITMC